MNSHCENGHRMIMRRVLGKHVMYCWTCMMKGRRLVCEHDYGVRWEVGLLGVGNRYRCNHCDALVATRNCFSEDMDIRKDKSATLH
jgi:hypothetical protein